MDAAVHKKRFVAMVAIDLVCLMLGLAAIVGHVSYGVAPLLWVFVGCIAVGVGAQVWFLAGLFRNGRAT